MHLDRKGMLQARLEAKNIDRQFQHRIEKGMGCSPFVSEAVVKVVHELYFPLLSSSHTIKPGQILFQCLSKNNKASTKISDAEIKQIFLTLDDGINDLNIRRQKGVEGLRRYRLCRLANEAYNQGALLTVEDLAYRLLNVGERTIIRDLSILRKEGNNPPLRSTVKDIGRTTSHKKLIVKNWLWGDELSDLERKYHHSISAVENYISTFKRVIALSSEKYSLKQIAYVLKISVPLAKAYMAIWEEHKDSALPHRSREMMELLKPSDSKKKNRRV
ncbi:hypothetical protein CHISP_3755 [Chitinispirillum alkaliphilum]|nr:hypothetical protein CHISP_3755 [Chitinispirillum alkaliphilum]